MTHEDFTFEGFFDGLTGAKIENGAIMKVALGTPQDRQNNDLAHRAASAAYAIRSGEADAAKWKPLILALPEEIRELTRTYLEQHYRSQQHRKKVETVGRTSPAGDEAMRALAHLRRKG